jgi:hypothetical protein
MNGRVWRTVALLVGGPILLAGVGAMFDALGSGDPAGGSGLIAGFGLALVLLPFALRGLPDDPPE